jgi:hypothetical protein
MAKFTDGINRAGLPLPWRDCSLYNVLAAPWNRRPNRFSWSHSRTVPGLVIPGRSDEIQANTTSKYLQNIPWIRCIHGPGKDRSSGLELQTGRGDRLLVDNFGRRHMACAASCKKVPVIYLIHNVLLQKPSMDRGWQLALNQGNAYIVQSVQEQVTLQELIPNARIIFSPHPVYTQFNADRSLGMKP